MQTTLIVLLVLAVVIVATYFVVRNRRVKRDAERPLTPPAAPIPGPSVGGETPPWLASANAPEPAPTWSSARTPDSAAAAPWSQPAAAAWDTQSVPAPGSSDPASSETVILPPAPPSGSSWPEPETSGGTPPPAAPAWDHPVGLASEPQPEEAATPAGDASAAPAAPDSGDLFAQPADQGQTPSGPASSPAEPWAGEPGAPAWSEPPPAPEATPSQPHGESGAQATTGWADAPAGGWPEAASEQSGGGPSEASAELPPAPTWSEVETEATTAEGEPAPAWGAPEPAGAGSGAPDPAAWETQTGDQRWEPTPAPGGTGEELGPAPTWGEVEAQPEAPAEPAAAAASAPGWGDVEGGPAFPSVPEAAPPETTEAAPGPAPVSAAWAPPRDLEPVVSGPGPEAEPNQTPPAFEGGDAVPTAAVPAAPDLGPQIGETMILNPLQSPAAASPQAEITIESGPDQGHMYRLSGQGLSMGRSPDNDLILRDPATSGHHARIEARGTQYFVVDLGSTNGTLVNGEPVQEKELSHGDRVTVGQNQVKFSVL